jgi:undecaprenyl-diphosphatase
MPIGGREVSITVERSVPARRSAAAVARDALMTLGRWIFGMVSTRRIRPGQAWPATARAGVLLLGAAAAVALVAATMLTLDGWVIAQQRLLPPGLIAWFAFITDAGRSGWVLGPLAAAIIAAALISSPALGRVGQLVLAAAVARAGYVFMAVLLPGLVVTIVKRIIGRGRPYLFEQGGPFMFQPFGWDPIYASLPSGHTTTAFAAAFAAAALYPRLRWPIWGLAVLIGVSRIVVSAHYPSDVLAAAVVGTLGALAVRNWFAMRRLAFRVDAARRVVALPGPSWRRLRAVIGRAFA